MTLAIPEVNTVAPTVVTGPRVVATVTGVLGATGGIAVEVVPRAPTAESGVVGLPPATEKRAIGTEIASVVDGAAEDAVAVAAVRRIAAHGAIGGGRADGEAHWIDGHRRAEYGGSCKETSPGQARSAECCPGATDQSQCGVGACHWCRLDEIEIDRRIRFTWWTIEPTRAYEPATMQRQKARPLWVKKDW